MNYSLLNYNPEWHAHERPAPEDRTEELAAELLLVEDPRSLTGFLRKVWRESATALGRPGNLPISESLAGMIGRAGMRLLPQLELEAFEFRRRHARRLEREFAATRSFGLELEGLSPEDKEFELAKSFVRFARAAFQNALSYRAGDPRSARAAFSRAARKYAPGLASEG